MFGHLKLRNPEPQNPETFPFTFRNSGVVVCWCLGIWNREISNPETLKCWSYISIHFSEFGSCCVLVFGHLKSWNLEPRNPEVRGPHSFCILWFDKQRGPLFFVFDIYNRRNPIDLCFFSQNCRNIIGIICYRNNSNTLMNGVVANGGGSSSGTEVE